jgi:hypothetical protein
MVGLFLAADAAEELVYVMDYTISHDKTPSGRDGTRSGQMV